MMLALGSAQVLLYAINNMLEVFEPVEKPIFFNGPAGINIEVTMLMVPRTYNYFLILSILCTLVYGLISEEGIRVH